MICRAYQLGGSNQGRGGKSWLCWQSPSPSNPWLAWPLWRLPWKLSDYCSSRVAILKNSILGSKLALLFGRSSDILPKGLILLFHLGRTYLFNLCSRSSGSPLPALYSIFLISMVHSPINAFNLFSVRLVISFQRSDRFWNWVFSPYLQAQNSIQ